MNAKDMIAVMEYMKAFNKPDKVKRRKPEKPPEVNIFEMIRKKEEELESWKKFLGDFEKTHKKEDKKPDKKGEGLSAIQTTILLTVFSPILVGGYLYTIGYMFKMVAEVIK